jgi:hypothetical protein
MSLILDALSRSERERRAREQGVPDLLAAPEGASLRPRPRLPAAVLAALLVLLAAALAVGGYLLLPRPGGAPQADSRAAAPVLPPQAAAAAESVAGSRERPPPAVDGVPPPSRAATVSPAAEAAAVSALYAGREAVAAETPPRSPAPADVSGSPERPEREAPVAADATADAGRAPEPAAAAASTRETPVDLTAALRQAQGSAADAALAAHPTPLLSRLSKQYRDRVPTLMYLRHDYASAGGSTVTLNGTRLRAGQRSGAVQVVEILPDSVILRFDGEDFRLRALNSWINL